ncbi:MAG: hypothetical protein OHK0031_15530 [Anaerolineales bacterium]
MTTPTRLIPFHTLTPAQIAALAELHVQTIHGLLSELGPRLTQTYYQAAHAERETLGLVALAADGTPLGWALGSPAPARLNAQIRGAALREAARRPSLFPKLLIGALASAFSPNALPPGGVELTYLGVAASARGQGLGATLLREFLAAANAPVALSVETDNAAALHLYRRFGFEIRHTFQEGPYRRYRMINDK